MIKQLAERSWLLDKLIRCSIGIIAIILTPIAAHLFWYDFITKNKNRLRIRWKAYKRIWRDYVFK